MRSWIIMGVLALLLSGCAISGRGDWPHPVWIWECWKDKGSCD